MFISSLGNLRYDKNNSHKKIQHRIIKRHHCTRVNLLSNNKRVNVVISRMVAIMFVPIPERYLERGLSYKDLEADHIDASDKADNSVFNLQWLTPQENKLKAKLMKEHPQGEDRPNATITNKQVENVCKYLQENKHTVDDIYKKTGVPTDTIYHIKSGKIWIEISSKYDIKNYTVIKGRCNSQQKIHKICKLLEEGYSCKEISKMIKCSYSLINNIKNKHRWTSISKYYNI